MSEVQTNNTEKISNEETTTTNGSNGTTATAAEDALAKAKAIAAKLAQTTPSEEQQQPTKRKRWGTSSESAQDDDGDKRYRPSSDNEDRVSRKIMIPVERNPGYNYVGLLIGPGGSKQKALQAEAGGRVKIQVRGKGANNGNPLDEPLHVLLEGEAQCVDRAETLINDLLQNPDKADAEKSRQLTELGISKGTGDGNELSGGGSSSYKPMPVAQIIGNNMYGPGGGSGGGEDAMEEQVGVPNGVVGYIIGKGGESITSMQRRSGCRVQIQKEHEMEPNSNTRIITLVASTQEAIDQCRTIIEQMVEERQRLNAQQTGTQQLQQAISIGQQLVTVQVPDADVGLIIGKGGCNIRAIQDRSGANIQIPQGADADNPLIRTCTITHPTLDGANFAKQMVEDILRTKTDKGGGTGGYDFSLQVMIPDKDVGMIIGRQGCVIREMQSKTGTRIQIPSQATPGMQHRVVTVSGPSDGCHTVKSHIERMITEQSSQSVMAGTGGGQGLYGQGQAGNQYAQYGAYAQQYQAAAGGAGGAGGQYGQQQQQYAAYQAYGQQAQQQAQYGQQQQAATGTSGQQDYSKEWAAYYAAQAQQQQGGAATATPAPAPAAAQQSTTDSTATATAASQDPTAYYDQFYRYALYYGEEAARKTYGAWAPPVGTPNPYGNAPATAPAAAGTQ